MRLVVVESPAKAKTIGKYLGPGYQVLASVGHVRDLPDSAEQVPAAYKGRPWAAEGVDVGNGFEPLYVVPAKARATITELKQALQGAEELLLATDEDREGEAIAWHLLEVLRPKVPVRRMVFHEITREAITAALADTRDLDMDLVQAQETRRIVDRLYGYRVSDAVRKKGGGATSAGRVQSAAVRLVVQRERDRIAFTSATYCDVRGTFAPGGFPAALVRLDDQRIATGKDFDDDGVLQGRALVLDEEQAQQLAGDLAGAGFSVVDVAEKPGTRRPGAPFTTSTLQQEAGRRLRWSAKRAMDVAQHLYQAGYITYMRTDSTALSQQAVAAARAQAEALYGADHVSPAVRTYANKARNAQEAHEAIRPAGDSFRTPGQVAGELSGDAFRLYELVWQRTVASQMADARISTTTVQFTADDSAGRAARFSASGTVTLFEGYRKVYADTVEEARNPADTVAEATLPVLAVGDTVTAADLAAQVHRTAPPARYTEASLVQALEALGIGRPSTYAKTIETIQARGYVVRKGSALVPAFSGMAVTQLLEQHAGPLVDYGFTATVEDWLDAISNGQLQRLAALTRFYDGGDSYEGLQRLVARLVEADGKDTSAIAIPGTDTVVRVSKHGPYLLRPADGLRADLPGDLPPDELTAEVAHQLIESRQLRRELGPHPGTGLMVVARVGTYGPYVTEEPPPDAAKGAKRRTASLFKAMDPATVTLEQAVALLDLPRVVGTDPASGEEITARTGRYGPYLQRGGDRRSLDGEEQVFTVTLEEALAIYAQPKRGRGAAAAGRPLGEDPATGLPVEVRSGRYGPYVTDGQCNATLQAPDTAQAVTLERAVELLAVKRAAGPAGRKRGAGTKAAGKKKASGGKGAASKGAAKKADAR